MNNPPDTEFEVLDAEITSCIICQPKVKGFSKPGRLYRGPKANVMIIGQGPGKTELTSQVPFSGQSGKRLNQWLIRSGADPQNPRKQVYCTSIVKCYTPTIRHLPIMIHNCRTFLFRQMILVRPSLVITLGQKAYEELRLDNVSYEEALCTTIQTSNSVFITSTGFHYTILVWPHPSGLNRWHNKQKNKLLMEKTFPLVREHLIKNE